MKRCVQQNSGPCEGKVEIEVHDDLDNHPDVERRAFTSIVARRDLSTRGGPRSDRGGWRQAPAINFNFLSSPPDAEPTVRAVRIARAIMTAPAMAPFQVSEVAPGADRTADDEILDWVKNAAETTYHPVGTCSWCRDWRDLNGKAKVLDAADEAKDLLAFRTAVEVLARGGPRRRKPMYRRKNRTPDGETALARGFEPWL